MDRLPSELQSHILNFLDWKSILTCRLVHKKWDSLVCTTSSLKRLLPPVRFNLRKERMNGGKPLTSFLEVVKGYDRGQEFPFCNFMYDFHDCEHISVLPQVRLQEDWGTTFKGIKVFGKEFGIFVKGLVIRVSGGGYNFDDPKKCSSIHSLIAQSPNVHFLKLDIQSMVLVSFKPFAPLMMLEELEFQVDSDLHLMHLLFTPSTCPKLKKLKVNFQIENERVTKAILGKLKEFQSLSVCFEVSSRCVSNGPTSTMSIDCFRELQSTALNLEKLALICWDSRPGVPEAMSGWLSTLSSTLQVLSLRLFLQRTSTVELQIPKLEVLKELSINIDPCGNIRFLPLEHGSFQRLTTIDIKTFSQELVEQLINAEGVFPTVTRLRIPNIGELPLDNVFPNLEELGVYVAKPEDLTFVLTRMTQLKHLELGNLDSLSISPVPTDDSWMLRSAEDALFPCFFGNMTSLSHLRLFWDNSSCCTATFLRDLAYLSTGKDLRRLSSLVIKWATGTEAINEADEPAKSYLQRIRECHHHVRIGTGHH